jgi:GGDEF domain-containing protein
MHRERGGEGDLDGVREVVLRVATELLEARRGLLLTRRPGDHAGVLHLVASRGFANEPGGSQLVARFAREVLEPGTTLRQQRDGPDAGDTAADAEVSTLVAIPLYVRDHFQGILVCADRRGGFGREDDEVLLALGDHVASILHTERLQAELRESYAGTVQLLAEAIDARDPRLHGHAQEVARYAEAIGRRLEVEPDERRLLSIASLLHDVGTVAVSERVLLKPGPLNEQEREVIELHPRIGAQVVSQVPALRPLAPAILHHHERFDGTGYPGRLAGEDIPAPARLIAVAEAFSAMTQDRPHRGRRSVDEACAVLEAGAGTQFDPEMVRLLVEEVRADPDLVPSAHRAGEEADVIPLLGAGVGALTDNLTLLSSHRAFRDAVDQASRTAAMTGVPFAVALVRLLDLPVVNRRDGYAAGDELIRAAAAALDRFAVRVRGVSGRDGGSRLGLLVPRTDEAAARHLAVQLGAELRAARAVRIATAVWRPGDSGEALARRALRQLAQPRAA